jgi:hypothetical protein
MEMRRVVLSLTAAAALFGGTAANAAITIVDHSVGDITVGTPDNVTIPNFVDFDTTTNTGTTVNPWFDFTNDQSGYYIFDLTSSTTNATITLEQVLSDGATVVVDEVHGTSRFLELDSSVLQADATYRFTYTFTTPGTEEGGGGTLSGNASFYAAPLPEPATWAMMLIGFGGIGMAMRRRRTGMGLAQIA